MPRLQLGQFPAPRHVVAHLSDVHLLADGVRVFGAVEPEDGLHLMLDRLRRLDPPPQALVFTGDLADRGEPDAYRRLRAVVEPVARELGAALVWVMGNHDDRGPFARLLLDEDLLGSDATGGPDGEDLPTQDRVYDVDGLRIVALDTSVPGYHHGELRDAQLEWLAEVLATPAEHGTLLAMHHPPVPSPMIEAAEIIALQDPERLAPVIAGTDVRGILGGHFHFSTYSTFAGVPVSVCSASCYTCDPAPLERLISAVDGHQSFTMMHLYDDRVVHTVVPLAEAPEIDGYASDVRAQLAALSPEERREMFSAKHSDFNRAENSRHR